MFLLSCITFAGMLYYCNNNGERPVWMTDHHPSVLWHCWLGHQIYKNMSLK